MKSHHSCLFAPKTVYRTIRTFLNTGDVKPCRLGRPFGSVTLFEHEEYILMECILQTPQIQLHEIANHIFNASGSAFSPQTLCRAMQAWNNTQEGQFVLKKPKFIHYCLFVS